MLIVCSCAVVSPRNHKTVSQRCTLKMQHIMLVSHKHCRYYICTLLAGGTRVVL